MAATITASFLFSDLVGSTALATRLGENEADRLRRQYYDVLRDAIRSTEGEEVKSTGDGVMVVFSSAAAALRCAVAMQQGIDRHNRRGSEPLGLRVGVSIGEAEPEGGDYYGPAVVEAARLCENAEAGQIVVGDLLRQLMGSRDAHVYRSLGPLSLKGLGSQVPAHALVWSPLQDDGPLTVPLPRRLASAPEWGFVGRDAELQQLAAAFKRSSTGDREVVLIGGEAGIGKTRLAAETAQRTFEHGTTVLYGRCDEDISIPYGPVIEALSHLVRHIARDVLDDHVATYGGELARIPELGQRIGRETVRPDASSDGDLLRFFDAVVGLLARASEDSPILIVLDDLHWADQPTLHLVKHIAASDRAMRVLLIGTYRRSDVAADQPLARLLADLRSDPTVSRIALGGLDGTELMELIQSAAGYPLDAPAISLAQALRRETDGNPFFATEILRNLAESGAVVQDADGRWTIADDASELRLPESVLEVIGQRLARLSQAARRVLDVAAVAGDEFSLVLLERVRDAGAIVAEGELFDALDEAVGSGTLTETDAVEPSYRFSHALIRKTIITNLTSVRRRRLHRVVGEALERLPDGSQARVVALAHHFFEAAVTAGDAKAAEYCLLAAQGALDRLAYEDGLEQAEHGLEAMARESPPDLARRAGLRLAVARAKARLGETGLARIEAWQAAADAEAVGSGTLLAEIAFWYAAMGSVGVADPQVVELCERALGVLPPEEVALRSKLTASLAGRFALSEGDTARAQTLAREAVELGRASGDRWTLGWALGALAISLWGSPEVEERLGIIEEIFELDAGDRQGFGLEHAHLLRAVTHLELGDLERFSAEAAEIDNPANRWSQVWYNRAVGAQCRALRAMLEGRFDEAEALSNSMLTLGATDPNTTNSYAGQIFYLRREQGRLTELSPFVDALVAQYPTFAGWRLARALVRLESGERDAAVDDFRAATTGRIETWSGGPLAPSTLALAAEVSAVLSDAEHAAAIYQHLSPYAGKLVVVAQGVACIGAVDRFLGMLSATTGAWNTALEHYQRALALEERIAAQPQLARTLTWQARLMATRLDHGDGDSARTVLIDARATASSCGMNSLAAEIEELLARPELDSRSSAD